MADQKFTLSIDDDWKRQAQEEKKRLAEQEQQQKQSAGSASAPTAPGPVSGMMPPVPGAGEAAAAGGPGSAPSGRRRAAPGEAAASFSSIVQSMLTQALYFLGELGSRGGQSVLNLDMARYQLDQLTILEEKTKGNLAAEEQQFLDAALYEARNRFVAVASQLLGP